ncbi:MAG: isoaspartyl peptidase/L-asparaginase [Anaerolineae bacterium]|nr:isoaspartyl peptidase/L-asparaginase [Anaerolineae bacterium]
MATPKIMVHGGAGSWQGFDEDAVLDGVRAAALAGWTVLKAGGTAVEAVEAATIPLEDNPLYDAGVGSFLNELGEVEMDALITDGRDIRFGAVAAVRRVKNPIILARKVMTETDNCFFAGDGADMLAVQLGIPLVSNIAMISDAEWAAFQARQMAEVVPAGHGTGTVGAVAIDVDGHLASATSTGGTLNKKKGRVGDSPIFGAGGYADDLLGAASATGIGENIMRFLLCKRVVDGLGQADASTAAWAALDFLTSRIPKPEAGLIVCGADGSLGAAHTTAAMPIAWVNADGTVQAAMRTRR